MVDFKKTILVDFDGVIHSYTSGWKGADVIPDPPVPGALIWLYQMVRDGRFDVRIFSTRNSHEYGVLAMTKWFKEHGLDSETISRLEFSIQKPPAFLTIDDRAFHFKGRFPSPDNIDSFKPWNENG